MVKVKKIMFKNLGTKFFILSMLTILIFGIASIVFLYFLLNPRQNPVAFLDNYQPVTSLPVSLNLDISSPDDNLLLFDGDLLISGKTVPGALVLITTNDQNLLFNAASDGYFSKTIKLQSGVNQFTISSFDNLGNYKTEFRTIYYSEEKL